MFSARQRTTTIETLQRGVFDVVIVGGGINGASVARDAALRGYSVALIDSQDFGAGTSSRSSRLIHGGLRYLEHAAFGLVFEALSERALLAGRARHLVRPLHFVMPVYRGAPRGLLTASIGMWLYEGLAMFRNYRRHSRLSADDVCRVSANIRTSELRGAVGYYDYRTDDARLVFENALSAAQAGASVISYARAERIDSSGRFKTIGVRDLVDEHEFEITGRSIICCAGPWTDRVLPLAGPARRWLHPTKGVHIVVPGERLPLESAVLLQHPADGRVLFALPFHERTVLGTTDTFFDVDPQSVRTDADDVDYLLEVANYYFPGANLSTNDVFSNWAGVRPLLVDDESDRPGAVSREHRIDVRRDGIIVVAGGKLTTYRRIAAECVDAALETIADAGGPIPQERDVTRRAPLPGAVGLNDDQQIQLLANQLGERLGDPRLGVHLAFTYGVRAGRVIGLIEETPALGERMIEGLPYLWAQVVFAAREEMAVTLSDTMIRRMQIFYRDLDQGLGVAPRVAELMARELRWDEARAAHELEAYRAAVARSRSWRHDRVQRRPPTAETAAATRPPPGG